MTWRLRRVRTGIRTETLRSARERIRFAARRSADAAAQPRTRVRQAAYWPFRSEIVRSV